MRKIFMVLILIMSFNTANAATPVAAKHGMVVSENALASQIGADILQQGGNAIDAAVAVGYALAVVNPCCGNIGGGGFMTVHFADGKNVFLNFREKAPLKANKDIFLDAKRNVIPDKSTLGYLAVGVPGTVLGLDTALQKYGTLTRAQVMAPAIKLAQQGFPVTPYQAQQFKKMTTIWRSQPNITAIFFKNGQPLQAGDKLVQTNLSTTLKAIADHGSQIFYKGYIAKEIVAASKANGGLLSLQDFAKYNVETRAPIVCTYRGYQLISAPPPSSGGITLCEILNILENFSLKKSGYHTAESAHLIVSAMRYGFADRNDKLGDPNFVMNPTQQLISKKYAAQLSKRIQSQESSQTTHYSIMDKAGNAVAVTYTINGLFGANVIASNTGFFLNNEMDDFTAKPGAPNQFGLVMHEKNSIQAGKRPLSSMTPTVVMKDGRVAMVIGSPGGPRIITSVLLTLINVIDYGMNIQEAVNAPRFHYQVFPNTVYVEPDAFSATVRNALEKMGYQLMINDPWSDVEAIQVDPATHTLYGANDIRTPDGAAIGY